MLTLALALSADSVPSSIAMALDVFRLGQAMAGRPLLKLLRLSTDGRPIDSPLGLLTVDGALDAAERADCVLWPAIGRPTDAALQAQAPWIHWLRTRRPRRAHAAVLPRFASICSAAYVLAEAGVLDGRRATTHWSLEQDFRRRYPAARLAIDEMFTHDGDVACSGGSYAGVDLCLHLLRLAGGDALARQVANVLVVDEARGPQRRHMPRLPPLPQLPSAEQDDAAIGRLQRWIEAHHAEPLTLAAMADQVHCSPRSLLRRFKLATGLTPIDYLQRVRIAAAEAQLANPQQTVEAVAWAVGYEDRAAFAKAFKRVTGQSPAALRRARLALVQPGAPRDHATG
jgi:transcriptional regulator GlxA family with amidase domain